MIRFRPHLGPTLFFLPAVAMMIGLGFWQLQRLAEKEALLASIAAGMNGRPIPLDEALSPMPVEWRRVEVTGRFDHTKEAYLFAQGRDGGGVGAHVLTPLTEADGKTVLIDRGFVPEVRRDPATRKEGQVEGETTVTGVLRLSSEAGTFTPQPDRARKLWFGRNVPEIASALGIDVPPILVEADATANPGGLPVGGQTNVDIPNNHLSYAITWFGLALTLTVIYLLYHRSKGRLSFGGN